MNRAHSRQRSYLLCSAVALICFELVKPLISD